MIRCPVCKKKLMLSPTMQVGSQLGCVNCGSVLEVVRRNPDELKAVPQSATHNPDSKPESYA